MERCILVASIPVNSTAAVGETRTSGSFVPGGYSLVGDVRSIEVWKLDESSGPLDLRTLSWNTRPRRTAFMASLYLAPGVVTRTREFECATDSLHIFEFACPWEDCEVSWWQDKKFEDLCKYS
jgi:hypothetical protein